MIEEIALVYTIVSFIGWNIVISLLIFQSITNIDDSTYILNIVRCITLGQIAELMFIKKNEITSPLNIAKYIGFCERLVFQWIFMRPDICFCSLRNTLIGYNLSEIIRSAYYLSGKNAWLNSLRVIIAPIIIPFCAIGMFRLVNRAIEANEMQNQLFFISMKIFVTFQAIYSFGVITSHMNKYKEHQSYKLRTD